MAGITLDECIQQFDLADEVLDTKCSDKHILDVSRFLDWKGVASYLKLTGSDMGEVDSDGRDEAGKQHKTLQKWKSKFAFKATYRNLIQALLDSGKGDHAEEVCKLLQKGSQEEAASGRFEERNARSFEEPRQKYRKVQPPEECQQDEQVQQFQMTSLRAEIEELKEQLQANESKLLQKDAELSTMQAQLGIPLRLSWKQYSDMPFSMNSNTCPVTLKGKVYMVGRGACADECTVVVYDTHNREWSRLRKQPGQVTSFGMAVVQNQVTLVGGLELSPHKVTDKLAVWESESKQWTSPYPPMHTARYGLAATTYSEWMAVAGGWNDNGYLDSVEILNSTEKQWYSAAPLPIECTQMKSAVVRDEWYLLECYNEDEDTEQGFAVSLPALILLRENASSTLWRNIPSAPVKNTATLAARDLLFAVGGRTNTGKHSSAIYLYLPWKKEWIEVGMLPTERSSCTSTELPGGEILVAGGSEPKYCGLFGLFSKRVDIATVMDL